MKIKFRANRNDIITLLLIFPYFESYTITILENQGYCLFSFVGILFTIARLLVDFYVLMHFMLMKKIPNSITGKLLSIYCLIIFFVGLLHGVFRFNLLLGLINNISSVLLLDYILKKYHNRSLKPIMILFSILCVLGVISIIKYPNGFFDSAFKDSAVYFLGSKNGSGEYFLLLLLILNLYRCITCTKLKIIDFIITIIFFVCVYICRSANSMVCIGIVFTFMLLKRCWKHIYRLINIKIIVACALLLVFYLVTMQDLPAIFLRIISRLGKDVGFSGRKILWEQAINYFLANPLIGSGSNIEYTITSMLTEPHAHNIYLDSLAKAGIVPIGIMILMFCLIAKKTSQRDTKELQSIKGVFIGIILLHIGFENISIPFMALLFILIECIHFQEENMVCKVH